MISIYEVLDFSTGLQFLVWTLVACAVAKAVFGSFPAAEIQYRLTLRAAPRREALARLNWEVRNRMKWDAAVARNAQTAVGQPLTEAEWARKQAELVKLSSHTLGYRAGAYLMGCFACQTFWAAMLVFCVTRWTRAVADPLDVVLSAMATSAMAALLVRFGSPSQAQAPCSGPGCGGKK
jgi:hypothetical protein